jgi:hypothetical protein
MIDGGLLAAVALRARLHRLEQTVEKTAKAVGDSLMMKCGFNPLNPLLSSPLKG